MLISVGEKQSKGIIISHSLLCESELKLWIDEAGVGGQILRNSKHTSLHEPADNTNKGDKFVT